LITGHLENRNEARCCYRLFSWSDLFGGFSLAREYDRIRQDGRLYISPFDEEQAACQAFERLFRQENRKGYVPAVLPGVREASG
jgi:predicted DNA-binding WGR domain protein